MSDIVRRADLVDVFLRGGESLVLTESRCLHLAETATAAVRFLERPMECSALEELLLARFGPAPDNAVRDLLEKLVSVGVLSWGE